MLETDRVPSGGSSVVLPPLLGPAHSLHLQGTQGVAAAGSPCFAWSPLVSSGLVLPLEYAYSPVLWEQGAEGHSGYRKA